MGKMLAGVCRFLFEDVLQCGCQSVWLCKKWKHITMYAKAFTLCSIGTGLFLSFAVPLKEYIDIRRMRNAAGDEFKALSMDAADAAAPPRERLGSDGLIIEEPADLQGRRVGESEYPMRSTIAKFLSGRAPHGKQAHRGLILSAVVFWTYMASYPKIFEDQITCDGNPPALGMQIFFGLFVFDIILQVWVLIHTKSGYDMVVNSPLSFAGGVVFSLLGRFDTYGDVSFTYKLLKCDTITWFSIWENVFYLPCPLEYFAIFALAVGILCFQALPGLFLLCSRKKLPMAMKFNEFNLILSVMSMEDPEDEEDEQVEQGYEQEY